MRQLYPKWNRGDEILHGDLNRLSQGVEFLGSRRPGSNVMKQQHGTNVMLPPWVESIVEITEVPTADGIYRCKLRYYSFLNNSWASQTKEWRLDASEMGAGLSLGDRVVAFWDDQRGTFIPTGVAPSTASVWSGHLHANVDLGHLESAVIPWTQDDVDGGGIVQDGGDIILGENGWYDVSYTINFAPNEDDWSICEFNSQFRLDDVAIWRVNIDGESKLGVRATNNRGYSHKFKAAAGKILTVVVSNRDELDLRVMGNVSAGQPRCYCSVARFR